MCLNCAKLWQCLVCRSPRYGHCANASPALHTLVLLWRPLCFPASHTDFFAWRLRKTNLAEQSPWENCTSSSYTLTHFKKNNKLWKAQTCLYSLCFMLSDSSCLLWVTSRSSRERGSVNVSCIFWLQLNKNTVMLHSESLASRWHSMILGACTCGLTFRYRLAQVMKWSRANTIIL